GQQRLDAHFINVDIRVLSATNIDLETSLAQGRLRRELFYPLASVTTPCSTARSAKRYTHIGGLLH
ncbi:MAG: sigma 54-interacting transcriptional regulator, partial [Bilophila wadsworthia]